MMSRLVVTLLTALLLAAGGPAEQASIAEDASQAPAIVADTAAPPVTAWAALNWLVVSQINDFYNDINDPTNRPQLVTQAPAGVLRSTDINADGVADWIVTWPESAQFCGTGGCRVTVYLGKSDGLQRVFDRQVLDELRINQVNGETRIEGVFHHGNCGDQRLVCTLAWGLDPVTDQLVPRPSANGDVFSSNPDRMPIDAIWDEAST